MGGDQSAEVQPIVEKTAKADTAPKRPFQERSRGGILHFFDRMRERSPLPSRAPWKDVLIRAKHGRNKEVPDNVEEIDLGSLGEDLEAMTQMTIADPTHREVGKAIRIRQRLFGPTKIFMEINPRYGTEGSFRTITFKHNDRKHGQVAAIPHVHPADMPQSPADIHDLLLSPRDSRSDLATIVETVDRGEENIPGRKILVLRGKDAAQLTREEADKVQEDWDLEIERATNQFETFTGDQQEYDRLQRMIQDSILLRRAQELGLKVFIAEPGQNVARLQKPNPAQTRST